MAEFSKTELGKQLRIWPAVFRTEFVRTRFGPELEFRLWPNLANIDGVASTMSGVSNIWGGSAGPSARLSNISRGCPLPAANFVGSCLSWNQAAMYRFIWTISKCTFGFLESLCEPVRWDSPKMTLKKCFWFGPQPSGSRFRPPLRPTFPHLAKFLLTGKMLGPGSPIFPHQWGSEFRFLGTQE